MTNTYLYLDIATFTDVWGLSCFLCFSFLFLFHAPNERFETEHRSFFTKFFLPRQCLYETGERKRNRKRNGYAPRVFCSPSNGSCFSFGKLPIMIPAQEKKKRKSKYVRKGTPHLCVPHRIELSFQIKEGSTTRWSKPNQPKSSLGSFTHM